MDETDDRLIKSINNNEKKKKIDLDTQNPKKISVIKDQIKNIDQIKTLTKNEPINKTTFSPLLKINSFNELISIVDKYKEIELKYDLERNVKLSKFEDGKIEMNFNENLNKNFIKKLSQNLFKWTGKRWIISLSKDKNLKTFHEVKIDQKNKILNKEKESIVFKEITSIFPDADLKEVEDLDKRSVDE